MRSVSKKLVGAAICAALCVTPAMASAATPPVQSVNPMVAVSLLASPASAATLCGVQGAAATALGAGCVLPVTDLPPPVVQPAPPPPPPLPVAAAPAGFGIAPLLIGLLGVAALIALLALDGDDDDDDEAVSPN